MKYLIRIPAIKMCRKTITDSQRPKNKRSTVFTIILSKRLSERLKSLSSVFILIFISDLRSKKFTYSEKAMAESDGITFNYSIVTRSDVLFGLDTKRYQISSYFHL